MAGKYQERGLLPAIFKTLFVLSLFVIMEVSADFGNKSATLDAWIDENLQAYESLDEKAEGGSDTVYDDMLVQAESKRKIITVSKDGAGDFRTVTDAVNSIPIGNSRRIVVYINGGNYKEKMTVDRSKPFVTFYGNPNAMPKISFDGTAAVYGTKKSATVAVESNYFMAVNIIFENFAPKPQPGEQGKQAVAMRISGDKAAFYNCHFLGFQDTLCDDAGQHYFKNCLIQGSIDFIFGNGRSLYEGCVLNSVADNVGVTAIVAQGRSSADDTSGFSFVHCKVTGSGSAHLSRAWRGYSRVVFCYTYMDSVVNHQGWDDNGFPRQSLFYGEYKCKGPGANKAGRVKYAKELTDLQALPFLSPTYIQGSTWLLSPPSLQNLKR